MAGSKRANILGYTLVAHPDHLRQLRRLSIDKLRQLFRDAGEHGQTLVTLNEEMYALHRQPDHTFTLVRQSDEHRWLG